MTIRKGANQPGCDLRTINRLAHDSQASLDGGDAKPGEVKQLGDVGIDEQPLQVRGLVTALAKLHHVAISIAGRKLHQAKAVANRVQPHGFGVDGDRVAEVEAVRQVAVVKLYGHCTASRKRQRPLRSARIPVSGYLRSSGRYRGIGAQEKTRTSTTFLPQVPETCASTNSATWATWSGYLLGRAGSVKRFLRKCSRWSRSSAAPPLRHRLDAGSPLIISL